MTSASQPAKKPTIVNHGSESAPISQSDAGKRAFIATTLNMSWQMAVAFLVPVFLGTMADKKFDAEPIWTIVGFAIALASVTLIVWRQMKLLQNSDKDTK